jgi:hypothetical protein
MYKRNLILVECLLLIRNPGLEEKRSELSTAGKIRENPGTITMKTANNITDYNIVSLNT